MLLNFNPSFYWLGDLTQLLTQQKAPKEVTLRLSVNDYKSAQDAFQSIEVDDKHYAISINGYTLRILFDFAFTDGTCKLDVKQIEPKTDPIVDEVREDLKHRSEIGIKKYRTTLDRTDLSLKEWINHAYEEALDLALYLKRAMKDL